jgi:hypothetical protein
MNKWIRIRRGGRKEMRIIGEYEQEDKKKQKQGREQEENRRKGMVNKKNRIRERR